MLRIIDNKRIDITDDEYFLYENICNSYVGGIDMFQNLFETDQKGIIICLIPPKKYCAMEVYLYMQNIMIHQHLRLIYKEHSEALQLLNNKIKELEEKNVKNNS